MTYQLSFTEEEIKELQEIRYKHPHPRIQRKAEVLWLKYKGLNHSQIADITEICQNTMLKYLKEFQEGRLEKIKEINFYAPSSDMTEYKGTIENYFKTNPPINLKQAQSDIEKITGIKRSTEQIRVFLRKIGMKKRKVGSVPKNLNEKEQEIFLKRINFYQGWMKQKKGNE